MKQQHTASRHKQKGFVSPGRANEKLSSRVLDEADKSLEYTLTAVRGNIDGLTSTEAANRLVQFGPNEVTHDKPPHPLIQLMQAFKNPFVMVLIVLGLVSYVMDVLMAESGDEDWVKVIILGVMVSLSGLLRFWQEYRSAKAAETLKSLVRNTATVQRRPSPGAPSLRKEVAMVELVAGDIVHLQAGDMIPADIKLIESRDLFISQAVQNFGAMDVLCTDKTGTLTQDKIILEHHYNVRGNRDDRILQLAWLNSYHQSGMKNLMDIAVIEHADVLGDSCKPGNYSKVDELPFDFVRRRLSVIVQDDLGQQLMVSKGAVEEMISVSSHIDDGKQIRELDEIERRALLRRSEEYNADGYRVLIVATRDIPATECKQSYRTSDEVKLVVRGFLTFFDPPKDSAAPAIRALNDYGVAVKVLTGDNPIITSKVCRDVGLNPGVPLLGKDIEVMDDVALCTVVKHTTIFAKLTPLQKSRVVKALQANGNTVGFLGDGINDAPALRDADVGISVDSGADIAKETADIILLEKSLMVLEEGVVKGRETFGNILKYLNMTASSNFGNVFSVLVASAWLPWAPMLAMQMLIQNLVYDVSQMLLPWDKMDPEFLKRPRKWEASNIKRFMLWLGPTSSVFDISTFCLMWFVFGAGAMYATANGSMDPLVNGQAIMNSGWFIEGLVSQTLVVHMLRTRKIPFLQSTATLPVLLSTSIAIAIGCYLPFSPLAEHFGFITLEAPRYFMWLVITMLAYMGLTQAIKTIYIKRHGQWF
ncbi:UNVERIFIED_CONTAM: magnesium-translocating P-type ATPase [Aeromonas salmonicida]